MPLSNECTITDITKRVGVSISAFSRMLNGRSVVLPITHIRVQRIIDELGYQPYAQVQN
jgi:DNA-binding LacI/PurR family transcriptional regulator